jgi:hypothetical protein
VPGVENVSTADNGTADRRWILADAGDGSYRIRNGRSGELLGILGGSTAWGARAVQDADKGSRDNLWQFARIS